MEHNTRVKAIENKYQEMAGREKEIARKDSVLEEKRKEIIEREEKLRKQELSMKEKRNQLFKSYDILTEKIY